jgi:hypothetical protein
MLLTECFDAGLVLDALEERAFPAESTGGSTPLSWNGRFSEIPPVLVGRMRRPADHAAAFLDRPASHEV